MQLRTFDRIPKFDERSRNFRAVAGLEPHPLRSYTWGFPVPTWLDQGQEGACTGFAWAHELACRPAVVPATDELALRIYHRGQQLDEWEGEDYSGTSVLAGAKAVSELQNTHGQSLLKSYRWVFGLDDLVRVLGYRGPVVLGINWYSGMWATDEDGFVRVEGEKSGGHAILARGIRLFWQGEGRTLADVDLERSFVLLRNSWGQSWGLNGDCKVSLNDMDMLLQQDGEGCVPLVRHR